MDNTGVIIESEVYGENNNNSSLYLNIKKNNNDFIHLTIHLSVKNLDPKDSGVIHIFKNIYKTKKSGTIKTVIEKKTLYTLISVLQPLSKPNSLEFSITHSYIPLSISNTLLYEPEIKEEINVIINVLNKLFDEDNTEFYIGNQNKLVPIHNKTNIILKNMNKQDKHVSRKNKGKMMNPQINNYSVYTMIDYKRGKTMKKTNKNKSKKKITLSSKYIIFSILFI